METFVTQKPKISKLFVQVRVFYTDLARTWVIREEANSDTPQKVTLKDSIPGNGNIDFFEAGPTKLFADQNNIGIITYLDIHKVDNVDDFISNLKIEYQIVEDDDIPGHFFENKTYTCKKEEMLVSPSKESLLITKVIQIQ
ncbi:hypothetical protein NAT51_07925 [Flavobacterium amniphilum]|uniref:hypothetical protein n=1 Tax=Flavobacterium amniphilum TaxID=1834035 RepID=UPI002029D8D0|nr:hypothetical protein [Flavobacterium amniphilum]MCL9805445.1 hypothetical protein [Flavobacterium amniphilum]